MVGLKSSYIDTGFVCKGNRLTWENLAVSFDPFNFIHLLACTFARYSTSASHFVLATDTLQPVWIFCRCPSWLVAS